MTPSHRTSLVRSHSNSASSTSSHDSASDSPTASNHEDQNSRSTSHKGDGTDDDGMANSTDEAPKADEHQDSDDPTVMTPTVMMWNPEKLAMMQSGPLLQGVRTPQNLRWRWRLSGELHNQRRHQKALPPPGTPRPMLLAPLRLPLTWTRSPKWN